MSRVTKKISGFIGGLVLVFSLMACGSLKKSNSSERPSENKPTVDDTASPIPSEQKTTAYPGYNMFGEKQTCYVCTGSGCLIDSCAAPWGEGKPFADESAYHFARDAWKGRCEVAQGQISSGSCLCEVCSVPVEPVR